MFYTNFKYHFILFGILAFSIFTACEKPQGIVIDPPEDQVNFMVNGQVDGQDFTMDQDVILVTNSDIRATEVIYQGTLHSECEEDIASNCQRSLSITFLDSLNGSYNADGYPTMLEPGVKTIFTGHDILQAEAELCIIPESTSGGTSISINSMPIYGPFCISSIPNSTFFEPYYIEAVSHYMPSAPIVAIANEVMVRKVDEEIEYYYFELECFPIDPYTFGAQLVIRGEHDLTLEDFYFDLDGFGIIYPSSPITFTIFEPVVIYATHIENNQVSSFSLFPFVTDSLLDSIDCVLPLSFQISPAIAAVEPGIVLIEYQDEIGRQYSTIGTDNDISEFVISTSDVYLPDNAGNGTVTSSIYFNGNLVDPLGDIIEFSNVEMTVGIGYIPR